MVTRPHPGYDSVDGVKLLFELVIEEPTLSEQSLIKEIDKGHAEPVTNMQSGGTTKLGPRTVC